MLSQKCGKLKHVFFQCDSQCDRIWDPPVPTWFEIFGCGLFPTLHFALLVGMLCKGSLCAPLVVFFSTHHPATLQGMRILTSWPCRTHHPCFYEITRVASSDGRTMSNATSAWNDVFYVNRKPQIDSTVIGHCPCSKIVLNVNCRYLSVARNIPLDSMAGAAGWCLPPYGSRWSGRGLVGVPGWHWFVTAVTGVTERFFWGADYGWLMVYLKGFLIASNIWAPKKCMNCDELTATSLELLGLLIMLLVKYHYFMQTIDLCMMIKCLIYRVIWSY